MSLDDTLRDYALQDLDRFCLGRDLTDTELAVQALRMPRLLPRERLAATALDALASYEAMRKRTVEETTSSIGMDEDAPDDGLTFEQVRHLWARREVYRRAALEYAYTLGNARLIEHYQTPEPTPSEADESMDASNASVDSITTAQVAAIFDALPYAAENWPKRLSDTKWLETARVALGAAGGATSLWNPAKLAQLIHGRKRGKQKQKTLEALNRKFKSNPVLKPWRAAWNEHYAMFNDADGIH